MKTELLEYHRAEASICRVAIAASRNTSQFTAQLQFHERAVEWLESLIVDRVAMDLASRCENKTKT